MNLPIHEMSNLDQNQEKIQGDSKFEIILFIPNFSISNCIVSKFSLGQAIPLLLLRGDSHSVTQI
jgi:hypothetical protein